MVGFALAQFLGALGHAAFQVGVEPRELAGLAMQFDEHPDLGAQHFRNDGHGDVVDRAPAIAVDLVGVGKVDAGDEDDCSLAEARMLANHVGQLETVQLRHADVHEDDGDVVSEEDVERLLGRRGLDQILAQLGEDHLVAQELGGLVVHHQDVDFLVRSHRFSEPGILLLNDAATCAARRATARC